MEVFKGYLELPNNVIPVCLQVYTICYWLSPSLMVNQIQIVSPKMVSWLNKSCFSKPWKELFVFSWLTHHTNISIRIISKKLSVSVQLEKCILSHSVSLSPALSSIHYFLSFSFFNLPFFLSSCTDSDWVLFLSERLNKNGKRVRYTLQI